MGKRAVDDGHTLLVVAACRRRHASCGGGVQRLDFFLEGVIELRIHAGSAAQAAGFAFLFQRQGALDANFGRGALIVLTLTAGCALLMWMGELITKRGIGNGISLLIFAAILTGLPLGINAWVEGGIFERLFFPIMAVGIVVAVLPSLFIAYGGFSQASAGALGGTSVLIAVGVALDTMRQMESQMMMRSYEGFLK